MKKFYLSLLGLFVFNTTTPTYAQNGCSNVVSIETPSNLSVTSGEQWHSFTATSTSTKIKIDNLSGNQAGFIHQASLYKDDCQITNKVSDQEVIPFINYDGTSLVLNYEDLELGTTYYLKLSADPNLTVPYYVTLFYINIADVISCIEETESCGEVENGNFNCLEDNGPGAMVGINSTVSWYSSGNNTNPSIEPDPTTPDDWGARIVTYYDTDWLPGIIDNIWFTAADFTWNFENGRDNIHQGFQSGSLESGVVYYTEAWYRLDPKSYYSTGQNCLSIYVSNGNFSYINETPAGSLTVIDPLGGFVINPNTAMDEMAWNRISGVFTATGAENTITITNPETVANTEASLIPTGNSIPWPVDIRYASYFVDDVQVLKVVDAGEDVQLDCNLIPSIGFCSDIEGFSYSWTELTATGALLSDNNIANPTIAYMDADASFELTVTLPDGSTYSDQVNVYMPTDVDHYFYNGNTAAVFAANATLLGQTFMMSGNVAVGANLNLETCSLRMSEGARIDLENNTALSLTANSLVTSCDGVNMYKGIYADHVTESINVHNCELRDAISALSVSDDAVATVNSSLFKANITGITFLNGSSFNYSEVIRNSFEPDYLGTIVLPLLNNPANTTVYQQGIMVGQMQGILIGDYNTFSNVLVGVRIKDSYCGVETNIFEMRAGQTGIYTEQSTQSDTYILRALHNSITGSSMSAIGIKSFNVCLQITSNEFNNLDAAVQAVQSHSEVSINANEINNCKRGIYVSNVIPLTSISLKINDNSINQTQYSIHAVNIPSDPISQSEALNIYDNTISAWDPTTTNPQFGIKLDNCDYALVNNNTISVSSQDGSIGPLSLAHRAIDISDTQKTIISDNTVQAAGTGVRFAGSCNNTLLACNALIKCDIGVYCLPSTPSTATEISDQGVYGIPTDNVWQEEEPYIRALGDVITQVDWYHRGDLYDPQVFAPIDIPLGFGISGVNFQPNSEAFSSTGDPLSLCSGVNGIGTGLFAFREDNLGEIVRDEIVRDALVSEFDKKADEFAFATLKKIPDLLDLGESDDIVFQSYYDLLMASNIGAFHAVYDKMKEDDAIAALQLNTAIVTEDLMDSNQKTVNQLYLEKYSNQIPFTEAEYETLVAIATLTPHLGGDAVYAARVMTNYHADESGVAYRIGAEQLTEQVSADTEEYFTLQPNPAQGLVSVNFKDVKISEGISLRMYNSLGQEVFREVITSSSSTFAIDHLRAGMYICHIRRKGEILQKQRLIIID